MLAESIRAHLKRHTHPTAHGIPDPRSNCLALHLIHCPPCSRLRSRLFYPSHNSSEANFPCRKYFRVHRCHHFRLDDGRCGLFSEHSIIEFVLERVPLRTKPVSTVIFRKGTTGSRSGAQPSSWPARRRRRLRECHTLSRVNTVWLKQKNKTVIFPTI